MKCRWSTNQTSRKLWFSVFRDKPGCGLCLCVHGSCGHVYSMAWLAEPWHFWSITVDDNHLTVLVQNVAPYHWPFGSASIVPYPGCTHESPLFSATSNLTVCCPHATTPIVQTSGPWMTKWTGLVATYYWITARKARWVQDLHEKYGISMTLYHS